MSRLTATLKPWHKTLLGWGTMGSTTHGPLRGDAYYRRNSRQADRAWAKLGTTIDFHVTTGQDSNAAVKIAEPHFGRASQQSNAMSRCFYIEVSE